MNDSSRLPIGLFDSGMGGLTVFKALAECLPGEDLLYLGDTARLPYGTKGRDTITRYTLKAAQKLVDLGVKMLVIACNTATSAALPQCGSSLPRCLSWAWWILARRRLPQPAPTVI
jgi:Glutamate racemase